MDPKRDMDERVNLEMDPEDALRALLGATNDGVWEPGEEAQDS